MPPEQEGVTQEGETGEPGDKGLFRFMRRRPGKEKRSETEWVDTLRAQPEPEPEPEEEPESPFMAGEEPEPVPEAPPEPTPEHYRVERQWRRRHKDEMDEIHSYIDRVIGTDRDPLVRHRRLAEIGVSRHPAKKREIASVDVEGLDEELMIAFTFPQEELRSARMVYETEGGYVIEVTRAVGGDDEHLETQHYTVSRVGSVAHALDKLRAREIEQKLREEEPRPASTGPRGGVRADPPGPTAPPPQETESAQGPSQEEASAFEQDEASPAPTEESTFEQEPSGKRPDEPETTLPEAAPEPPAEPASADAEQPPTEGFAESAQETEDEEPDQGKSGFMGGFASRFKRDRSGSPPEAPSEPGPEEGLEEPPMDRGEEQEPPAPVEETQEEPPAKKGGFGAFTSKLKPGKKSDKNEAEEEEEEASEPPRSMGPMDAPEAPEEEQGEKKSPFGGLASRFKRSESPSDKEPASQMPSEEDPGPGETSGSETDTGSSEDDETGKKGLFGLRRRGKKSDDQEDES